MGRKKSAPNCDIRPWLSGRRDCREGRYIQVGNSLLLSEAFRKLSGNEHKVYFALCMESGGRPTAALSSAGAKKYGINESTFRRSIDKLIEKGFISCDFEDNPYKFKTNVYRFRTDWKK